MRQRSILSASAVVTAAVLILGGCAGGDGTPVLSENAGKITIAVQEDVRSPDNLLMRGTTTDRLMLGSTVYEPLFTTDEQGEVLEQLARENGMDLRVLHARQDVAWAAALPLGLAPSTLLARR